MAMVRVDDECVDIRVSWIERIMLAEKPRRIPLASIRSVDPHPPLLDMMVYWNAQSGLWASETSTYHGHMIPSARKPGQTVAIRLDDPEDDCVYVQLDDETPDDVAERIERALCCAPALSGEQARGLSRDSAIACADLDDGDEEGEGVAALDAEVGGTTPPRFLENLREFLGLGRKRDIARLGSWLVALGSFGVLLGTTLVAAEYLPGLVAVGAGLGSCLGGGLALALIAPSQS